MNISIIYFSGTGNTEVVASLIEAGLNETNDVDVYKVEDILLGRVEFDIHKYDLVGFGYPIYGFNAPSIIYDFIKRYKNMNNLNTFIFSTCAGPLYLNDIASFGFKNKLRIRGFSVIYERQFYMPANILTKYDDRLVKQLYNKAVLMVEEMVSDLESNHNKVRLDNILSYLVRFFYVPFEWIGWMTIPLDFKVKSNCDLCLKCVENCPQNNIKVKNEKIKFGTNCLACFRCVYECPQKSIKGRLYNKVIFKDDYDIKRIIADDEVKDDFVTKETTSYYKVFIKYFFEK